MSTVATLTARAPRAALHLRISEDRDDIEFGIALRSAATLTSEPYRPT
jgi:hypothetical protein